MKQVPFAITAGLVSLAMATSAVAAAPPDDQSSAQVVVRWTAKVEPSVVIKAGAEIEVALDAAIDPGWHLYAITQEGGGPQPLAIKVAAGLTTADEVMKVAPLG